MSDGEIGRFATPTDPPSEEHHKNGTRTAGILQRGMGRFMLSAFCVPQKRKDCPICQLPMDDDRIVLCCGCAVCKACMQDWVQSRLEDTSATLVLHCPACRSIVRPSDTERVMTLDRGIRRLHSDKLLSEALRADPEFRPCPHCNGGGFASRACMAEVQRQRKATFTTRKTLASSYVQKLWIWAGISNVCCALGGASMDISGLLWLVFGLAAEVLHSVLTRWLQPAIEALDAPIEVGCPDCGAEFKLTRASNGVDDVDAVNDTWLGESSRECPRCRAPVEKRSGSCNLVTCCSCRVHFCWACMSVTKICGAWTCKNGAPFGNAQLPFRRRPVRRDDRQLGFLPGLHNLAALAVCARIAEVTCEAHLVWVPGVVLGSDIVMLSARSCAGFLVWLLAVLFAILLPILLILALCCYCR